MLKSGYNYLLKPPSQIFVINQVSKSLKFLVLSCPLISLRSLPKAKLFIRGAVWKKLQRADINHRMVIAGSDVWLITIDNQCRLNYLSVLPVKFAFRRWLTVCCLVPDVCSLKALALPLLIQRRSKVPLARWWHIQQAVRGSFSYVVQNQLQWRQLYP